MKVMNKGLFIAIAVVLTVCGKMLAQNAVPYYTLVGNFTGVAELGNTPQSASADSSSNLEEQKPTALICILPYIKYNSYGVVGGLQWRGISNWVTTL